MYICQYPSMFISVNIQSSVVRARSVSDVGIVAEFYFAIVVHSVSTFGHTCDMRTEINLGDHAEACRGVVPTRFRFT